MATLADELLNDFEDSEDEQQEGDLQDGEFGNDGLVRDHTTDGVVMDANDDTMADAEDDVEGDDRHHGEDPYDENETKRRVEKMQLGTVNDVRIVAGLMKTLQPVLEKIAHYQSIPSDKRTTHIGSIEDNPEYKLLTASNFLSTQIDSEVILVHKFIRDHYSTRFPELEDFVKNPLDYAKTVSILKNGPLDDINRVANSTDNLAKQTLKSILSNLLTTVATEGQITRGVAMDEKELDATLRACQMTLELDKAKKTLTDYVRSQMNIFAPNLTALIGSLTAAQLLNFTGGIQGLAKTPNRNVPAMGSKRQKQAGLATNVEIRQQGYLYQSELIQAIPGDQKIQAMRIVSAKLVLAARVDSVHESQDGSTGIRLRDECLTRLDKLTEAAPNRGHKALPIPGDGAEKKKRGGRRKRAANEAKASSTLDKERGRLTFGNADPGRDYGIDEGRGTMGNANSGKIRATKIEKRLAMPSNKSKGKKGFGTASSLRSGMDSSLRGLADAGIGSTLQARGLRTSGVGGNPTAGNATSLNLYDAKGVNLVIPARAQLKRKLDATNAGYFSGGTSTQINTGANEGKDFKKPILPPNKKTNTAN